MDYDTQQVIKKIADAHNRLVEEVAALTCLVIALSEVAPQAPAPERVKALVHGLGAIPFDLNRGRIESHAMKLLQASSIPSLRGSGKNPDPDKPQKD